MSIGVTRLTSEEFLEKLAETGVSLLDQAPEYCQELLAYGLWSNLISGTLALLSVVAVIVLTVRMFLKAQEEFEGFVAACFTVMSLLACLLLGGVAYDNLADALKTQVAPKVYIVEQLKGLK